MASAAQRARAARANLTLPPSTATGETNPAASDTPATIDETSTAAEEPLPPSDAPAPDVFGTVMLPPGVCVEPLEVKLQLPIGIVPAACFISRHLDAQLSPPQARAMRSLWEGLMTAGAKLANGRRVVSAVDALRYVLEQIAAGGTH